MAATTWGGIYPWAFTGGIIYDVMGKEFLFYLNGVILIMSAVLVLDFCDHRRIQSLPDELWPKAKGCASKKILLWE